MVGPYFETFSIGVPFQTGLHQRARRKSIGYTIVHVIFAQIIIQDQVLDALLFLSFRCLLRLHGYRKS